MLETLDTHLDPTRADDLEELLEWAYKNDDKSVETHAIEVKSTLNFTDKAEKKKSYAKIIKFILATSNRSEELAIRDFHGYAVMIIGVEQGKVQGVKEGPEEKDFKNFARPYFGVNTPSFHFRYVTFHEKQILLVLIDPPVLGQPVYICSKDFPNEGLKDGYVFYRGSNETSLATSAELRGIIVRSHGGVPKPRLLIEGCFIQYRGDWIADRSALNRVAGGLIEDLRRQKDTQEREIAEKRMKNRFGIDVFPQPIDLFQYHETTIDEHIENLMNWAERWPLALKTCLELVAPSFQFNIQNCGAAEAENPHVEVLIPHGRHLLEVEEITDDRVDPLDYMPWNLGLTNDPLYMTPYVPSSAKDFGYRIEGENMRLNWSSDSVSPGRLDDLSFEPRILQVEGNVTDTIEVSWKIYAKNLHPYAEGKIQVPIVRIESVQDLYRAIGVRRRIQPEPIRN